MADQSLQSFGFFHGSKTKDSIRNFVAGSVSGFVCKIVEYPLDTIKVLQQTSKPGQYTGPIDVAIKTVKSNGFMSLYKGLNAPLVGSILENAFIFSAYKKCQTFIGIKENEWSPRLHYAMCGLGGGVVSSLVLTPTELIKCQIQVQQSVAGKKSIGPLRLMINIIKEEGIRGLFRGHLACMSRELPGNFVWFGVYESLLREICERGDYKDRASIPLLFKSLAGSFSGVCYWAAPFPFDTAKSLIQTDARFRGKGTLTVLKTVFAEQGLRGVYQGLFVTLTRAAPAHFLIFFSFEFVDEFLKVW